MNLDDVFDALQVARVEVPHLDKEGLSDEVLRIVQERQIQNDPDWREVTRSRDPKHKHDAWEDWSVEDLVFFWSWLKNNG